MAGVGKSMFTWNLKNWRDQELRGNIKIRKELVVFSFHFHKNVKVFTFMIWGLMDITGYP